MPKINPIGAVLMQFPGSALSQDQLNPIEKDAEMFCGSPGSR